MEKTKQEIENYMNSIIDSLYAKKKAANKRLHEIRLYHNEYTKFVLNIDREIREIIEKNGISDETEINNLIAVAREIKDRRKDEISVGGV